MLDSVSPGQQVVKIVNDVMIEALGGAGAVPLNLNAAAPMPILMVGLQGSGKTTTSGKLGAAPVAAAAKKVLLASLDTQRPAAQLQLQQLARAGRRRQPADRAGETPVQIARRAMETGRREVFDVVILDTAGRLSIDADLMDEVQAIRAATNPAETLLVVDAMTGQDAVNTARAFNDALGITGIVHDPDGRRRPGWRRAVDARHHRRPDQADRVGREARRAGGLPPRARRRPHPRAWATCVGLVERAAETIDQEEAEKLAKQMAKGQFDLDDFAAQLKQITKMGSISSILGMLPGAGKMQDGSSAGGEPRHEDARTVRRRSSRR